MSRPAVDHVPRWLGGKHRTRSPRTPKEAPRPGPIQGRGLFATGGLRLFTTGSPKEPSPATAPAALPVIHFSVGTGNCWLDVPGLLHIDRSGRAPGRRPPRPSANLGTAAAARVLRALLSPGNAGHVWTQRSLQTETRWEKIEGDEPVSLGLVNKVIQYLREEGYVEDTRRRGTRVRDPGALLKAWSNAYRFDHHYRRSYFTLLKGRALHEALYRMELEAGGMAAYAAFSAAERQAPHVRQPKTWIYVGAAFLDSLAEHARAKEVDTGENLVVLIPDDSGVFVSFEADTYVGEQRMGCTDPVQTYVDLMHCGGRGEEAAKAVLEQRILPPWKVSART